MTIVQKISEAFERDVKEKLGAKGRWRKLIEVNGSYDLCEPATPPLTRKSPESPLKSLQTNPRSCAQFPLTHNCLFCIFNPPPSEFLSKNIKKNQERSCWGVTEGSSPGRESPSVIPFLSLHLSLRRKRTYTIK